MISKITSANLCKPIHDIMNYCTFICPFESGKCGKGKIYKNKVVSRDKKSYFNEITFIIVFEGLSFGENVSQNVR